jgi:tetratricopeptide (TPR) repeat protein
MLRDFRYAFKFRRRKSPCLLKLLVLFLCTGSFSSSVTGFAEERPSAVSNPISLIESGHYKQARAVVEERYRSNPKDPETFWLMSRVNLAFHNFDAALDFAEKALAADPRDSRYHLQVASTVGRLIPQANLIRKISLGMRFKKEVDAAVALDPNNVEALLCLMEFYLGAPGALGGDIAKARTVVDRIMRLDPVQAYHGEAALARHEKQLDRIDKLYLQAVKVQPRNYETHQKLADWYENLGKFDDGEKHAREAIRIDPGRVYGHLSLITLLVDQNKMAELDLALKDAEKAIPDNLAPYYRAVAKCLERRMELPNCYAYLRKYLTREPEPDMPTHADAHRLMGNLLYAAGRRKDAIGEFQLALKLDPDSPAKRDLQKIK